MIFNSLYMKKVASDAMALGGIIATVRTVLYLAIYQKGNKIK